MNAIMLAMTGVYPVMQTPFRISAAAYEHEQPGRRLEIRVSEHEVRQIETADGEVVVDELVDVAPNLPVWIYTRDHELRRQGWNLVELSTKFTAPDGRFSTRGKWPS
ncbi:hypothetical protein ACGFIV_01060 [Sphaerisporangium sp. NPDC049003]|uniref:hypothetical protein n=1 Tax=Sphaerisporangium sp. NPDC049003 TaxID=3364517 RepID=UPI003720E671